MSEARQKPKDDGGSWEKLSLEELRIVVRDLVTEVRTLEGILMAVTDQDKLDQLTKVVAPARYKKYKHIDTGNFLCDTDSNPGPKWKHICVTQEWVSQTLCDNDPCQT